jgi:hypothetical protein
MLISRTNYLHNPHWKSVFSNGAIIAATHTATLYLSSFPMAAMQSHILPGLAQHSLLYVWKMCDSGCAVTLFTVNKVAVTNGAAKKLTGTRDKDAGLWRVPLGTTNSEQATPEHVVVHNVYEHKYIQDTIAYLHASK